MEISTNVKPIPDFIVVYGPSGLGKISFGAAIPGRVFLIDDQEDGINTLKKSRLVDSAIPVLPPASTWSDVLEMLDQLATQEHDHKVLVLDTLGGMERLCHVEVCRRDFNNDWTNKGWADYWKGPQVALQDWRQFENKVNKLRTDRNMLIVGLAHSIVKSHKNPKGPDYDRFIPDMDAKTWGITSKWADLVLFCDYEVEVDTGKSGKQRAKGRGGKIRTMFTEYDAAYEAKNRHNLPPEIDMGTSGQEAWNNLKNAIIEARKEVK